MRGKLVLVAVLAVSAIAFIIFSLGGTRDADFDTLRQAVEGQASVTCTSTAEDGNTRVYYVSEGRLRITTSSNSDNSEEGTELESNRLLIDRSMYSWSIEKWDDGRSRTVSSSSYTYDRTAREYLFESDEEEQGWRTSIDSSATTCSQGVPAGALEIPQDITFADADG